MVRVRVRLGYTMAICLVLPHQVSTEKLHNSVHRLVMVPTQDFVNESELFIALTQTNIH